MQEDVRWTGRCAARRKGGYEVRKLGSWEVGKFGKLGVWEVGRSGSQEGRKGDRKRQAVVGPVGLTFNIEV